MELSRRLFAKMFGFGSVAAPITAAAAATGAVDHTAAVPPEVPASDPAPDELWPRWTGEEYRDIGAWDLLREEWPDIPDCEFEEALRFYRGEQWPADVVESRVRDGRPCLTINRLPTLVARLLANGNALGRRRGLAWGNSAEYDLSPNNMKLLIALVVRANRDAQLLYNYCASAAAERARFSVELERLKAAGQIW